jgi:polyisoprenoid-binding protein YceI
MTESAASTICAVIRRAASLAALATLASAAFAQAADGPTISIKLKQPVVALGQKERVSGRLATHDSRDLVLQVSRFPFQDGFHKDATGTSDKQGYYSAHVFPRLAERLRVRTKDGSAHSKTVTVYVLPRISHPTCSFKKSDGEVVGCHTNKAHGKLTLRVSFRSKYPGAVYDEESAKPVYVYYGQRAGDEHPTRLKLHGTVAQKAIGKHRVVMRATLHINAPQYGPWSYYYSLCTKSTEKSDGLGIPGHHGCGEDTVTYKQATSYKFS